MSASDIAVTIFEIAVIVVLAIWMHMALPNLGVF